MVLVRLILELERLERHVVEPRRLLVRGGLAGPVTGAHRVVDGLVDVAARRGLEPVERELGEVRVGLAARQLLERLSDLAVHPDPARRAELAVERLADERVRELVRARRSGSLAHDLPVERLVEQVEHAVLVVARDLRDDVDREAAGHRGRDGEHRVAVLGQVVSRRPMTSRTPSGRFSATPSAVPIHRPSTRRIAPVSTRCRRISATKNGLPSVSRKMCRRTRSGVS